MLRLLTDLPDSVVGVEAVGRVEASDYADVLHPALEAAVADHGKVRALIVLGEGFEGYSAGGAWADVKLGLGHWNAWERIALLTDHEWMRDALRGLGWMLPGDVRAFGLGEREAALAWLVA